MTILHEWFKRAVKDHFIFCVHYRGDNIWRVALRKGPLIGKRKWKAIKLELRKDGFYYNGSYSGWCRDIKKKNQLRIYFRF